MLEYIILGFLMYGEKSGYDLKQCMLKSTSNFFDASFGSIYPALKKLEAKGFISLRETVEGGKYKKLYAISEHGKSDFMNWLGQPVNFSKTRPDHLVKIFFFGFLPKEKAVENLKAFIKEVEPVLNMLKEHENGAKEKADFFQLNTLLFGINYYEFVINWSNHLLKGFRNV
ncbi:MAG: PadR family transcriptional regulator [Bacillota bacterium]